MELITRVRAGVRARWRATLTRLAYGWRFRRLGRGTWIRRPILLVGHRWISLGSRTSIRDGARIEAIWRSGELEPDLRIGSRVLIEQSVHIVCSSSVTIEDNVTIAARCAIVDTTHEFPHDPSVNVGARLMGGTASVRIGRGTMLGVGVVVLPNVTIGECCMIGANSVVTRDIPDGSTAAGVPARVLSRRAHSEGFRSGATDPVTSDGA